MLMLTNTSNCVDAQATKRMTALVIDDHPAAQAALRDLLAAAFPLWTVLVAANASEAIAINARSHPALAIVDVNLPDANGIDLAAALKHQRPALVTVMISVQDGAHYRAQAQATGAAAYLRKDRLGTELEPLLRTLL